MTRTRPRGYLSDLPTGVNRKLPGGGPWRILPECPARLHNSLSAARGRNPRTREEIHAKCICPRALALVVVDNERGRARRLARETTPHRNVATTGWQKATATTPIYMSNVKKVPIPDLSHGLCRTPVGMQVMDLATETGGNALHFRKKAAQEMCENECPAYAACLAWITSGTEQPTGSWGGIYAGMTPSQRIQYMTRKREKESTQG